MYPFLGISILEGCLFSIGAGGGGGGGGVKWSFAYPIVTPAAAGERVIAWRRAFCPAWCTVGIPWLAGSMSSRKKGAALFLDIRGIVCLAILWTARTDD